MLNGLDLFSGIGGITLGLSQWVRPVIYCERDEYARSVLLSRMAEGVLPIAPIWDDIRTLTKKHLPTIDMVYAGFPCQDISVAGRGEGMEGERSGLFFEIMRLAKEIQPKLIFLENVPAIRTRGLGQVGRELAYAGYDCRWDIVSAQELGAPHIRKRWFCLAYSSSERRQQESESPHGHENENEGWTEKKDNEFQCNAQREIWMSGHGGLHRMDNGLPFRMDRIKALGNAVVPAQVSEAFKRLIGVQLRNDI